MVITGSALPGNLMRWGGLLALSFGAHLYGLSLISVAPKPHSIPEPERIRISLSALAAPRSEPAPLPAHHPVLPRQTEAPKTTISQQPETRRTPPPAPATPKVVTRSDASKAIHKAARPAKPTPAAAEAAPQAKPVLPKPVPTPRLASRTLSAPAPSPVKTTELPPEQPPKEAPRQRLAEKPVPAAPATPSAASNQGDSASTVLQEASYRRRTPPVYPRRAYELGQQGTVTLAVLITEAGTPEKLQIEQSSGHRMLDRAALAAVKSWVFEPTTRNGQKTQSWVRVPVRFVIN
ncbi:energy transducer TonB [Sneathiella chinensis]|uniref:TonB C-terminal domain-containing protein n=1 Tax=Sneathiella chinensis TaxID=349750 RepID=A0ABQ5TZ64_9PROT|nr:energy transducer TonB [Sneathiella chinensis]GLQ04783.1 hypothetical protein GCM10007924_00040 [Sneathiella chinensis]